MQQYGNLSLAGTPVSGLNTLGENIAGSIPVISGREAQQNNHHPEYRRLESKSFTFRFSADNGGLKAAYNAYFYVEQQTKSDFPVTGLNFTREQLFFIGYSQVWCNGNSRYVNI